MALRLKVDNLDVQILEELQDDGRRPFTRIAADLGVSEGAVRQRVGRLVRRKVVKFVANVDALELGLTMAFVGIKVRGGCLRPAVEALSAVPEIDYVVVCGGAFDLMLELICTDLNDLSRILEESIRVAPGVEHLEAFITLGVAKDTYRFAGLQAVVDRGAGSPRPRFSNRI